MPVLELLVPRQFNSFGGFSSNSDPGNCPFCINDNDARIQYNPGDNWVLDKDNDNITTHSTTLADSSLTVAFNNERRRRPDSHVVFSGIMAVGTISGGQGKPPRVSYTVDSDSPMAGLAGDEHVLSVKVDETGRPYIINHFVIFPSFNKNGTGGSQPPAGLLPNVTVVGAAGTETESASPNPVVVPAIIALSVVVGLLLLALLAGGIVFFTLRRKKEGNPSQLPSAPRTMFTSEDSILHPYISRSSSFHGAYPFKMTPYPQRSASLGENAITRASSSSQTRNKEG
ncbi:hypothetical protein DL96DRAFT_1797908 [Flagelloscypha sp. PMI_526]|nr:hypothetical protein DL96DRAFT_1797908 [Flagelloscypha sp. PMI_526]